MTTKPARRRVADEIGRALEEALAYAKGDASAAVRVHRVHVPDATDVRALRQRLGLTQADFARRYGFALTALRDWEQGRRRPERSARVLLRVIEREPEAVERALG
jgi:putative transcriptional regulator